MKTANYRGPRYSDARDVPVPPDVPEPSPRVIVRKNQADMTTEERERFKTAILASIASGFYSPHVNIHEDMTHRMHGIMSGPIGFQRFLPWHRVYLSRLEEALRTVDDEMFVPYWRWTADREFPAWLADFRPAGITRRDCTPIEITRNPGGDPETPDLPSQASIDSILAEGTFTPFVRRLEGVPFGAHNQVHVWVGGTMAVVPIAPADPIFWLHHAEVDRLWHVWQQDHAGENPVLAGADAVLDPWPGRADDVLDIHNLGYTYG